MIQITPGHIDMLQTMQKKQTIEMDTDVQQNRGTPA